MSRVLVVDDEPRYREHMSRALTRDGHDVQGASSGREAIALGGEFHPRVLVADWMLQGQAHGLQVAATLQAILPDLRTILITGFPSADLRQDARSMKVCDFLEKPFESARLRAAVRAAEQQAPTPLEFSPIAVFNCDAAGWIKLSNERAQQLLDQLGGRADHWHDLGVSSVAQMQAAQRRWEVITPPAGAGERWLLRTRGMPEGAGWLAVVISQEQRGLKRHPVVQMLLDLKPTRGAAWPHEGRVLVVDDDRWVRHVVAHQVESHGGVCYSAASAAAALEICARDSGVNLVVLDYDLPGEDALGLIRSLQDLRSGICIVGTSGVDRYEAFAAAGAQGFLLKPWSLPELVALLTGPG